MTKVPNVGAGIPSGAPQAHEESGTIVTASLLIPEDELDDELDDELEEDDELELDELEELDELLSPDDELEEELLELEAPVVAPPQPVTAAKISKTKERPTAALLLNSFKAGIISHLIRGFVKWRARSRLAQFWRRACDHKKTGVLNLVLLCQTISRKCEEPVRLPGFVMSKVVNASFGTF
jgi:hypothetical protein